MNTSETIRILKEYIAREILDGKDIGLDETTPLLEWGIINSIEMTRLLSFIERQFHVQVPPHNVSPDHFTDIASIARLIATRDSSVQANEKKATHE